MLECLDKYTILVLTSFIFDRLGGLLKNGNNISDTSKKITRVSFAGNGDFLVIDAVCKHDTHLARLRTRTFFSCVWLKTDCSISVRGVLKQSSHSSHVMLSTLLIHLARHLHRAPRPLLPTVPFKLIGHHPLVCCLADLPNNPLSQMHWVTMRDDWRRCVRKGVTDPEDPTGANIYCDGCGDRWDRECNV